MSVCSECGSMLGPDARVCQSCGARTGPLLAVAPRIGIQHRFIGTVPFWKVITGFGIIIAGIIVGLVSSGFHTVAAIIIVMGVIVSALGAMSAKAPVEQVVYQT